VLQIGEVIITEDLLTERFACDLAACQGACCIEGDAGAPLTADEALYLEDVTDLEACPYEVDAEGEFVTTCRPNGECVFTEREVGGCLRCTLEAQCLRKPRSCSLYPLRMKQFSNGTVGLNYHRWDICRSACERGRREDISLYRFLRTPLIDTFGQAWYDELCTAAQLVIRNS
jgi:hypothetical protein